MTCITTYTRRITQRPCRSAVALSLVLGSWVLMSVLARSAPDSAPPALQGKAVRAYLEEQRLDDALAAALTAARYRVRPSEGGEQGQGAGTFDATNPAHHFRADFTPEELTLAAQPPAGASTQPAWQLRMRLAGYGYGARIAALGPGRLRAQDNRIDAERAVVGQADIAVTEWYVNTAKGLEQGFTLHQPPGDDEADEPLRLQLQVGGDLRAEMAADGARLWLTRSDGEVALSYGGLVAWDASGQPLAARMAVTGETVWLEVEEAGAAYPVTIDPTFVEQQKLTASDGAAGDEFGRSIAISGATIVVGAPSDDSFRGSAYVFERQGGSWVEQLKLTANDGAANDLFGVSVALSEATIVVGAFGDDGDKGSVYVFERHGGSVVEHQKLTASDRDGGDVFGYSVALDGASLVVGAPGAAANKGSAYVFELQSGSWTERQKLTDNNAAALDFFGISVALSGETIVVGADGDDSFRGSASVFERDGRNWVAKQKLTASDRAADDEFGLSAALSGPTIVIGALRDDGTRGSVYVFERQGGSWVEKQKLSASDAAVDDFFGTSVALSGTTLVVSAVGDDTGRGSAYVFGRQGGNWIEQQKLSANDGAADDEFGLSVAISGATLVVGAHFDESKRGSAYVFEPDLRYVILQLERNLGSNPDKIEDALAKAQAALIELTKQPPDYQAAIGNLEGAVGDLEAAIKDGVLDHAEGITLMNELAEIARHWAALAIAEGGHPEKIKEAQLALDAGDLLKASGQAGLIKEAVNKYKDALALAEAAR